MGDPQKTKKRSQPKATFSENAEYFGDFLEILRRQHPVLQKDISFASLVGLHPSYISKMKKGQLTSYSNIFSLFLPVLVAFKGLSTAIEARRWIEPAYQKMDRQDLLTAGARILTIQDRSLSREERTSRSNNFIASIDPSFSEHPDRFQLREVQHLAPPTLEKVKARLDQLTYDLDRMSYYSYLSHYHNPDFEKLIIQTAHQLPRGSIVLDAAARGLLVSGGIEAVRSLPVFWGADPDYGLFTILDALPSDTCHQAKDAWTELLSSSKPFWRKLAALVFIKDSDQCEIFRIVQLAAEEKDEDFRRWVREQLITNNNINGLRSIPAMEYLLRQIKNTSSSQLSFNEEWQLILLGRSFSLWTNNGAPLPEAIRDLAAIIFLAYLEYVSSPSYRICQILSFPDFAPWADNIAFWIEPKLQWYWDDEDSIQSLISIINMFIALGYPKVKQYLLEVYKNSKSERIKRWACRTLMKKTDGQFDNKQRWKYDIGKIPSMASYSEKPFFYEEDGIFL